ncbi:MAG: transcription elongation factor GreA [Chloroflexi bacterium]|nr:transcription elongation factor GreA [Chloroflexota bacterium]
MSAKVQFLTPEGRRKLEEELEYLCTVKRREIAQNLKAARQEGDIMENSAYDESKREQAFVEGRIRTIETILADAQILERADGCGMVTLGSKVTVLERGLDDPETYLIVGQAEADPLAGRISNESPLGRALLNKSVGDEVAVHTPSGLIHFTILAIE